MTKQDSVAPDKSAQRSESGAQRGGGAKGAPPATHVRRRPEPDQTRRHGRSHACAYQDHRFGTGREVQSASDHRSRDLRGAPRRASKPWVPPTRGFQKVSGNGAPKRLPDNPSKNADYFDLTPRRRPEDDRRDRARGSRPKSCVPQRTTPTAQRRHPPISPSAQPSSASR